MENIDIEQEKEVMKLEKRRGRFKEKHPCPDRRLATGGLGSPMGGLYCNLNEHPCVLTDGFWCDTYEDYLFECWQKEKT